MTAFRHGDRLGATWSPDRRGTFLVWAPRAKRVEVHIVHPHERWAEMQPLDDGYFEAIVEDLDPGAMYLYRLDGDKQRPDPASRLQPRGVHNPSAVVDRRFEWRDQAWRGLPLENYVIYELHVGAFTSEGTFAAIIGRLPALKELGITALEIMPVSQFPGDRNWGYDGVFPFAVQHSYGGPAELKRLVDACHQHGLAVVLDVVYNHLGPEGNYLSDFGPYLTDQYKTPWGDAVNFDQESSDEVRRFFIANALQWISEFHFDALRLDAVHAIVDASAVTFLEEMGAAVHARGQELNREVHLIAESERNDPRIVAPREKNGVGLDGVWNDDFHHALRVLLTAERGGYYQDFTGIAELAPAFRDGFVFTGQYSRYRGKHYGKSSRAVPGRSFVVFVQNHDQVGNRLQSDRLTGKASFEQLKLAAGVVLLAPCVPLLFMGEEYGEPSPFNYFVSHGDPDLIEAVRKGRQREFASFAWQGEVPDPQDERTFLASKLKWDLIQQAPYNTLWEFYRELLRLRREVPALARLAKDCTEATPLTEERVLFTRRWTEGSPERSHVFSAFHFGASPIVAKLPVPPGRWRKLLDSSDPKWRGPGSPAEAEMTSTGGGADEVVSSGEVSLPLAPWSFALFAAHK